MLFFCISDIGFASSRFVIFAAIFGAYTADTPVDASMIAVFTPILNFLFSGAWFTSCAKIPAPPIPSNVGTCFDIFAVNSG